MFPLRPFALSTLAACAFTLSACGGGDNVSSTVEIASITVAGDSLADVGTFGFKFTVQNAEDPQGGYPIWTQLIANAYGLNGAAQCAFYAGNPLSGEVSAGSNSDCRNFAVGAGRINTADPARQGSAYLLATQLAERAGLGAYADDELLLVDGGGNDAADLFEAYFAAAQGDATALMAMLSTLLTPAEIASLSSEDPTLATAAGMYMQKLAAKHIEDITRLALDKGAQQVMILNAPDITLTPRLRAVLAAVAQTENGAAQAAGLKAGIQAWITAFNTTLSALAADDERIAVADFYTRFSAQVANPESYGLSNATDAVCPVTGQDDDGLPEYNITTCVDQALDQTAGQSAGWWQDYTFSDGFHPTPYGHELMADAVNEALAKAGWQ